jgi:hypothetical protein
MHSPRVKNLSSRTKINVARGIITKSFIAKNCLLSPLLGFAQRVTHMSSDPTLLASHKILTRAVFVIGHHNLRLATSVLFVPIKQPH